MRLIVGFVIAMAGALLLVGQISVETVVTAALLALVALAWWRLLRSASRRRIALPRGGHAVAWMRAVGGLPGDTARIGLALTRSLGSARSPWRAIEAPFHFGPEDDAGEAGRRAVAVIAGSLTPDRIVVDVSPKRATASTHRLAGGSDGSREWLT